MLLTMDEGGDIFCNNVKTSLTKLVTLLQQGEIDSLNVMPIVMCFDADRTFADYKTLFMNLIENGTINLSLICCERELCIVPIAVPMDHACSALIYGFEGKKVEVRGKRLWFRIKKGNGGYLIDQEMSNGTYSDFNATKLGRLVESVDEYVKRRDSGTAAPIIQDRSWLPPRTESELTDQIKKVAKVVPLKPFIVYEATTSDRIQDIVDSLSFLYKEYGSDVMLTLINAPVAELNP